LAVAGLVGVSTPLALAHTDIEFTVPAADETVAEPVDTITVAFADPVTLVGAGFEVFTPQEQIVQPEVVTDDDTEFVLRLDPPLAGGAVGVRYEVVAADGHIIEGSFAFTVTAPAPAPTTAPATVPATAPAPTTGAPAPATTAPSGADAPDTTVPVATAPAGTEPAVIAPAPTTVANGDADGGGPTGLVIGVALAAVVAAGAFVLLRTRLRSTA
jgi:methionine-rich copper-binding protein CopC